MQRFKFNKREGRTAAFPRGITVFCAAALVVGITAMAAAVALTVRAGSAAERSAELMRRLAFEDARENLLAAEEALRSATEGDASDTERRSELLAQALDSIAGAGAALTRAGLGESSRTVFDLLKYCRESVLSALRDAGQADITELSKILEKMSKALASADPAEALSGQAEHGLGRASWDGAGNEEFDRGYSSFKTAPELTQDALIAKARAYFSANAVFKTVKGSVFPPALALCGENLYVSVSASRGELLEMYFDRPPGERKLSERECAEKALSFLQGEGIAAVSSQASVRADELCGAYFYRLTDSRDGVEIGVKWDTGRICYFNAHGYYK